MSENIIIAALSNEPQDAKTIAAKLDKPVSTVRKWLKQMREAGTILAKKIGNAMHYYIEVVVEAVKQTVEKVIEMVKPTRSELYAKVSERIEKNRTRMLQARTPQEKRYWKQRTQRATLRALALQPV